MLKTSVQLKQSIMANANGVQPTIGTLQKAIRELWEQVEKLQDAIDRQRDEITLKTGDASITLKKDGTIAIKGKDITINGSGKVTLKAGSDVVLKGKKIVEN